MELYNIILKQICFKVFGFEDSKKDKLTKNRPVEEAIE